uniref:Uncharacterized protein n=1 Tax=Romanomermis culicivorax TaxID=13658 RepID=A0A915JMQ0_ROMCU
MLSPVATLVAVGGTRKSTLHGWERERKRKHGKRKGEKENREENLRKSPCYYDATFQILTEKLKYVPSKGIWYNILE